MYPSDTISASTDDVPPPTESAAIIADARERRAPILAQSAANLRQIKRELPVRQAEQPIPQKDRNRLYRYAKLQCGPGASIPELHKTAAELYKAGY